MARRRWKYDEATGKFTEEPVSPEPEPEPEGEADRKKREREEKDEHPGIYL